MDRWRGALVGLCGLWLAGTAPAQEVPGLSAEIAAAGLARVEARLAGLGAPSDGERFALGGVRFLRGIERSLQTRWRHGMNRSFGELPVLRLPVAPNPAPAPYEAGVIAGLFQDIAADMASARAPLDGIADGAVFGVKIALADLWFDVNANGTREGDEGLVTIAAGALGRGAAGGMARATVRFDASDARWLSAYTHFLEGVAGLVLGYDPTAAIARAQQTAAGLDALNGAGEFLNALDQQMGFYADRIIIVRDALAQEPDAERLRAARQSFLAMIADNRSFWALLAQEADNSGEWIPNDRQTSALGIAVPEGMGATWLDVLADAEALLSGSKLMPYWRLDNGAGINLARMLDAPRPIDIPGWVQGADALAYAERGSVVTPENWRNFEALVFGDAMLFVLLLN